MQRAKQLGIAFLIGLFVLGSVFAGGQQSQTTAPTSPSSEVRVPMVWVGWSGSEASNVDTFNQMIGTWNTRNPNRPVSWVGWPWGDTLQQVIIRSQGGEPMDVGQLQLGWAEVVGSTGVLADLNQVIGREWLEANIPPASLQAGVIGGKQLAVPYTSASIAMMYNPQVLRAAGVSQAPRTIQEFEATLRRIKASNPDIIPYGMTTTDAGSVAQDLNAWLWTFGGGILDANGNIALNRPENLRAIEWILSLAREELIAISMSRFDARVLFAQGRIGFYDDAILARAIAINNGISRESWNEYIYPMDRPVLRTGNEPQSVLWGHQLVIFQNTKDPVAAAEFVKYLIGKENSLYYFERSGLPPVTNEAIQSEMVTSDPWTNQWLNTSQYGRTHEFLKFENIRELQNILTEELQAVLIGAKTPQQMLADTQRLLQAATR